MTGGRWGQRVRRDAERAVLLGWLLRATPSRGGEIMWLNQGCAAPGTERTPGQRQHPAAGRGSRRPAQPADSSDDDEGGNRLQGLGPLSGISVGLSRAAAAPCKSHVSCGNWLCVAGSSPGPVQVPRQLLPGLSPDLRVKGQPSGGRVPSHRILSPLRDIGPSEPALTASGCDRSAFGPPRTRPALAPQVCCDRSREDQAYGR